jgi:3-dehydroquinate synthase
MSRIKKVFVRIKSKVDNSYRILIGHNIFLDVLERYLKKNIFSKIGLVTDSNLFVIYEKLLKKLSREYRIEIFAFSEGEKNKNLTTISNLISEITRKNFDRKSLLIAFGGGVTGDLTGFLASIYMRGIKFIQVPTSLLAMVDSSIGGKTGVDTEEGKNLVGTFFQPSLVIIDTEFLKTLPRKEIKNGFAEIIKHGIIFDEKYFSMLENLSPDFFVRPDFDLLSNIIKRSCEIKSYVVTRDEKESGLRQILNFGHTIGHGLEKVSNFSMPHGDCVAIGMLLEAIISKNRDLLSFDDFRRIREILTKFDYLEAIGELRGFDLKSFFDFLSYDKKNVKGKIKVVLLKKIGKTLRERGNYSFDINYKEIEKALTEANF